MMKKTVCSLVVACVATVVTAQTTMTLGTFGYTKNTHSAAGLHISGMQFYQSTTNSPSTVYSTNLPINSVVHVWNGSSYDSATYKSVFVPGSGFVVKWTSDPEMPHSQGYWLQVPSAVDEILSGEIPMEDAITNSIVTGLQLCCYPYPVDRVITNLGLTPSINDVIHVWNGTTYDSSTYKSVFVPGSGFVTKWTDESLTVRVGEGFWYESVADVPWIATRPYPAN